MATKKQLDLLSLHQLADLMDHYNIYDSTGSGHEQRMSGPELKKYLQSRFRKLDKTFPMPKPPASESVLVYLNQFEEMAPDVNVLTALVRTLTPYSMSGHKALKRKPKEISREVVLALMESDLLSFKGLKETLMLMIHEDKLIPSADMRCHARGIDWIIYTPVPVIK